MLTLPGRRKSTNSEDELVTLSDAEFAEEMLIGPRNVLLYGPRTFRESISNEVLLLSTDVRIPL